MASRAYVSLERPQDVSGGIKVARVLCIFSVCYVHAWLGVAQSVVPASQNVFQASVVFLFGDVFGRSSVPLLSIISGWLVVSTLEKKPVDRFIAGKAATLLGPMLVWNLLAVFIILMLVGLGAGGRFVEIKGIAPILAETTLWNGTPTINVQNTFLRDMFVVMMAMPLLVRLPNTALGVLAGLCALAQIEDWPLYVLDRPAIAAFMLVGMCVRRLSLEDRVCDMAPYAGLVAISLVIIKLLHVRNPDLALLSARVEGIVNLTFRLTAAMLTWKLATLLAASRFKSLFEQIEPYVFLLFCSHTLVFILIGPVLGAIFGRFGDPLFPVTYLVQPVIAAVISVGVGMALQHKFPPVAQFLSGGRLKPGTGR